MNGQSLFVQEYRYSDTEPVIVTDTDIADVRFVLALTPDLDPYGVSWAERCERALERAKAEAAAFEASAVYI